jgi:hypothetical protein
MMDGHQQRTVLVVAHPGHELKVHGWLERVRPSVCVITDGSGRTNHSRLNSTTAVLEAAGGSIGPIYGVFTDQELYMALLDFDHAPFIRIVDQLASMLLAENVDFVAGDAEEGYNPAHDICRMIINAAVRVADRASNKKIRNFDFTLVGAPHNYADTHEGISVHLDQAALQRKLDAARNYAELQDEVAAALSGTGSVGLRQHPDLASRTELAGSPTADQFGVEFLRPVNAERIVRDSAPPFYELYGERQVFAGHYTRVLRYREHILPLAEAVNSHVES